MWVRGPRWFAGLCGGWGLCRVCGQGVLAAVGGCAGRVRESGCVERPQRACGTAGRYTVAARAALWVGGGADGASAAGAALDQRGSRFPAIVAVSPSRCRAVAAGSAAAVVAAAVVAAVASRRVMRSEAECSFGKRSCNRGRKIAAGKPHQLFVCKCVGMFIRRYMPSPPPLWRFMPKPSQKRLPMCSHAPVSIRFPVPTHACAITSPCNLAGPNALGGQPPSSAGQARARR